MKNQFKLTNKTLLQTVEKAKKEILPDEVIDDFVEQLESKAEQGIIPETWVKGYKATITKNQNKLKKAEEEKDNK